MDEQRLDISCRIHTTPKGWMDCPYSSIRAYLHDDTPDWLNKTHITDIYGSATDYLELLKDCKKTEK